MLVYGHYDVQPVEPLDEWRTPPFSGEIQGEWMLGRGTSDDKGPLFTAVRGWGEPGHTLFERTTLWPAPAAASPSSSNSKDSRHPHGPPRAVAPR